MASSGQTFTIHPEFQRLLEKIRNNEIIYLEIDAHQLMKYIPQNIFAEGIIELISTIKKNTSIKIVTTYGFNNDERKLFLTLNSSRLYILNLLGNKHKIANNCHTPIRYIKQKTYRQHTNPACVIHSHEPITIPINDLKSTDSLYYIRDAKLLPNGQLIVAQVKTPGFFRLGNDSKLSVIDLKRKQILSRINTSTIYALHGLKNVFNQFILSTEENPNSIENIKNTLWTISPRLQLEEKQTLPKGRLCKLADDKFVSNICNYKIKIHCNYFSKQYELKRTINPHQRETIGQLYPLKDGTLITAGFLETNTGTHWRFNDSGSEAKTTPLNIPHYTSYITELCGDRFVTSSYVMDRGYFQVFSTQTKLCQNIVSLNTDCNDFVTSQLLALPTQPYFLVINESGAAHLWKTDATSIDYHGAIKLPFFSFSLLVSDQELMTIEPKNNEFIIHRTQLKTEENFHAYCKNISKYMTDNLNFPKELANFALSIVFGKSSDDIHKNELSIARNAFCKWKTRTQQKKPLESKQPIISKRITL